MLYNELVELFHKYCKNEYNICDRNILNNFPGNNNNFWEIRHNRDDGHCFYHTILRYINDTQHFLKDELIPSNYNRNKQTSQDVYKIRKFIIDNNEQFKIDFFTKALEESKNNQGTSNWAGNNNGEFDGSYEFQTVSNLLDICFIIWQINYNLQYSTFTCDFCGSTDEIGYECSLCNKLRNNVFTWSTYTPETHNHIFLDKPFDLSEKPWFGSLYIMNTNANHFDTLIPKIHNYKKISEEHGEIGFGNIIRDVYNLYDLPLFILIKLMCNLYDWNTNNSYCINPVNINTNICEFNNIPSEVFTNYYDSVKDTNLQYECPKCKNILNSTVSNIIEHINTCNYITINRSIGGKKYRFKKINKKTRKKNIKYKIM